jgi:hypothetical protein
MIYITAPIIKASLKCQTRVEVAGGDRHINLQYSSISKHRKMFYITDSLKYNTRAGMAGKGRPLA